VARLGFCSVVSSEVHALEPGFLETCMNRTGSDGPC
jgi:hypothetical protein